MTRREKRELILACILGDGHILRSGKGISLAHGPKQLDYLEWKCNLLNQIDWFKTPAIPRSKINRSSFGSDHLMYFCNWYCAKKVRIYRKWMYPGNVKSVAFILKYLDHPRTLAIWCMDNGCVRKVKDHHADGSIYYFRATFELCNNGLSEADQYVTILWLQTQFGITGRVKRWRKRNMPNQPFYYSLAFNTENTQKLWGIIAPYVMEIPSMQQKFSHAKESYGLPIAPDTQTG